MEKTKIALVLSSGGARGVAHIGVIEELSRLGYEITSVAGCSMGAMIGAFYATGNLSKGKDFLLSLRERKTMLRLADLAFNRKGLIKGKRIITELEKIIPDTNIEDLSIPYIAIATNLIDGEEICFNRGNIVQAVRASISIPSIFEPILADGKLLVDGGISNPLPLDKVSRTEHDLLVGVVVSETDNSEKIELANSKNKLGLYKQIRESQLISINHLRNCIIDKYKPDILIKVPNKKYGILQFKDVSEIIENGIKATQTAINQFTEMILKN